MANHPDDAASAAYSDGLDGLGTLAQLYVLLDEWSVEDLSRTHNLDPDPTLLAAREPAATGQGVDEALSAVIAQIDIARPFLRGLDRDVVDVTSELGMSPRRLRQLLTDLHLAAADLHRAGGDQSAALEHLVDAAAYGGADPRPARAAAKIYLALGRFDDALVTFRNVMEGQPRGAIAVLELADEVGRRGAAASSTRGIRLARDLDPDGLVGAVAEARLAYAGPVLGEDALSSRLDEATNALEEGDVSATDRFLDFLIHRPIAPGAWYGLGAALRGSALGAGTPDETETVILNRAAQAFDIALELEPTYYEAAFEAASVQILLGRPDLAEPAARHASALKPDVAAGHAMLSLALRMLGQSTAAVEAASTALRLDASNDVAQFVLSTIDDEAPRG